MSPCREISEAMTRHQAQKEKCELVPLNKVGDYWGDDGNTNLLLEHNGMNSLAILDGEARVPIVTKKMWESWGKPT